MQKWSRSSARPRALAALSFTIVLLTLWVAFPADAAGTYKVKQGDTIQGIAQRHGVSWKALADANGLRPPYTIVVGRTLQIPGSGASASSSAASGSGGRIGPGSYTVANGDSVWKIASRAGVSWKALADANGLRPPYLIRAGQKLKIPGPGGGSAPPGGGTPSPPAQPGVHTVRQGETLGHIAQRYGTTVKALAGANGISNPNRVWVGQRIRIVPAGAPTPAPPTGPSPVPGRATKSEVGSALDRWSSYYGLPPDLVKGLAHVESGWQSNAVSSAGAVGVMQLMPGTAEWVGSALIGRPINRWDVNQNVQGGTAYLRWLLDKNGGNERLALASYYQGLGAVRSKGVYPQSEVYVSKVQGARRQYR